MWLRQLKKYWRSKARMIGSLGQPVLFLVALGFGLGPMYAKAGGGSYIDFLAPGIIAMSILFTAMFGGISTIWDRQFGFLKETLVAPVPRFNIMLGQTLGGATIALLQGVVMFFISLLIGFHPVWSMVPLALVFMALVAVAFTAFGMAISSRMTDMQAFPLIMNFIMMPLFFLSGSLFPSMGTAKVLTLIIKLNPLSYGVDGIRGSLSGGIHGSLSFDFTVLLIISFVMVWIGGRLFRGTQV
jgi:ABC-2 type transport system permease protein